MRLLILISLAFTLTLAHAAEASKSSDLAILAAVKARAESDKITAQPVHVTNRRVASACASRPVGETRSKDTANPHMETWIQVFARNLKDSSFSEIEKPLPTGAIVIKEKHHADKATAEGGEMPADAKLELFTVMLKCEAGYNPEGGDWEYAVVNGDASRILARGKIESCMECHRIKAKTDFLYRSYPLQAEVDKAQRR